MFYIEGYEKGYATWDELVLAVAELHPELGDDALDDFISSHTYEE